MRKQKIGQIIISVLLLISMTAGLLPSSVITAEAATPTDDASWTVIDQDKKYSGHERYSELSTQLARTSSSTKYIRLGADIKFEYHSNKDGSKVSLPSLTPTGDVVLDLNGHTIDIKNWYKKKERTKETMFVIGSGVKLTVIDSQGKGKIHADSYISAPEDFEGPNVYDIFKVDGGELVINAAGAEFECGRSKKQWVMSNLAGIGETYHGYARNQVCGSVIKVGDNAKVTVAGGTLRARGYESTTDLGNFFDPCAVIKGLGAKNVTVSILDGTFYGKGNAGVLQLSSDAAVTIRSGKQVITA